MNLETVKKFSKLRYPLCLYKYLCLFTGLTFSWIRCRECADRNVEITNYNSRINLFTSGLFLCELNDFFMYIVCAEIDFWKMAANLDSIFNTLQTPEMTCVGTDKKWFGIKTFLGNNYLTMHSIWKKRRFYHFQWSIIDRKHYFQGR